MTDAGMWQQLVARWERGASPQIHIGSEMHDAEALVGRVERATGWFVAHGARPGDRVLLQVPRSSAFLELFLGALAAGIVPIPVHARATAHELRHIVADAEPVVSLLVDPAPVPGAVGSADAAAALARSPRTVLRAPAGDDPACILYTSGTTGRPKGAVILHRNVVAGVSTLHAAWGWSSSDHLVHALPLDHVHGLFVASLGALWAAATTTLLDRFDPDAVWDAMGAGGTLFMGVPTFYHRLLASQRTPELSNARLFTCGSAPLPASVLHAFQRRFGHSILERYGMTEIGIAVSNPLRGERRPGAIGLPLPGVDVRVCDPQGTALPNNEVGELRIRGPGVFAGYLNRPDATAAALIDGEMRTGDLGFRSSDGYLTLTGRVSELILVGGLNVYPCEVEHAAMTHPGVCDAGVIGVPSADLGQVPAMALVATPGTPRPTDAEVHAHLRAALASFKVPRTLTWMEALPRNAMGKILRKELAHRLAPVAVRGARPEEAQAIADRNLAMAIETEGHALDPATALLGAQAVLTRDVGAFYLIAQVGDRTAGQLMVTTEWSDWRNAQVWWIQSVYVEPDLRGSGVYRALYEEVVHRASGAGAAAVRLYVDLRNEAAIKVYKRLGMDGEHYRVFEHLLPATSPTRARV